LIRDLNAAAVLFSGVGAVGSSTAPLLKGADMTTLAEAIRDGKIDIVYVKCPILKNKITQAWCRITQKKHREIFGENTTDETMRVLTKGCPCDIEGRWQDEARQAKEGRVADNNGKEQVKVAHSGVKSEKATEVVSAAPKKKKYQKIAPCINCKRSLPVHGRGMCGGCYSIWSHTPEDKRDEALAAFAKRVNPQAVHPDKAKMNEVDAAIMATYNTSPLPEGPVPVRVITLEIHEKHMDLYNSLCQKAEELWRDPDKQAMWMLKNALETEGALIRESSRE
jgi:hypothetical protein